MKKSKIIKLMNTKGFQHNLAMLIKRVIKQEKRKEIKREKTLEVKLIEKYFFIPKYINDGKHITARIITEYIEKKEKLGKGVLSVLRVGRALGNAGFARKFKDGINVWHIDKKIIIKTKENEKKTD